MFVVVLANTYLAYRVARAISGSEPAALVAAFAVSFHAGLAEIHYSPAVIYDVLCFFFYFLALDLYLRIRARGAFPTRAQMAAIAVLYICALNSKEMAVSFPVILLAYEWLFHRRTGATVWLTAALTAVYVVGKTLGPDALSDIAPYRPVFTWARYMQSSHAHLYNLAMQLAEFRTAETLLLWGAALAIALLHKKRDLLFWWCAIMVAPLPIVFLDRAHACLYIPLAAWASYLGILVTGGSRWVGAKLAHRYRWPACAALVPALVIGACVYTVFQGNTRLRPEFESEMRDQGLSTRHAVEQLAALRPRIRPHSKVIFLNDPFEDWDMRFIAELWFRDPTIQFWVQRLNHLPEAEVAAMDYVFAFENGQLRQLKPAP
jgi:hypothetical protein